MSLKGIIRRGGGYARRRDRSRYSSNPASYKSSGSGGNWGCGGCLEIILALFWLSGGLGLIIGGCNAITGINTESPWWFIILGIAILGAPLIFAGAFRKRSNFSVDLDKKTKLKHEDDQPTEEIKYLVCSCNHCFQKLEFPAYGVGTEIQCPNCGSITVLCGARGG